MTQSWSWRFKWLGTALVLTGAILTSLDLQPWHVWFLNLGSLSFLIWGWLIKDWAMITVNGGLLAIYTLGILIRLG